MSPRYSFQDIRVKKEDGDKKKETVKNAKEKKVVEGVRKSDTEAPQKRSKKTTASDGESVSFSIKKEHTPEPEVEESRSSSTYGVRNQKSKMSRGARLTLWGLAIITVLFLGVSIASLMANATVKVAPETAAVPVDMTITASRDSGFIPFEVVEFRREETMNIPAGGQETISRRASGTITIYNEYTASTQRLIRNTRFESPDGRVYRILESVEVPGFTRQENGTVIPGTLETTVYADEPGREYNQEPVERFTLPGLAGGPRFSSIYASSEGPIDGGFIGEVRMASEEEIEEAVSQLRDRIRDRLSERVGERDNAEETVFFPGSGFVIYDEPVIPTENQSSTVPITQSATLYAPVFDREALTRAIAQQSISEYDGAPLSIENFEELDLQIQNREEMQIPEDQLQVVISGQAQVTWDVNEQGLREALIGVTRSDFQQVVNDFLHISNAEAVIRPFWQRSFPEEVDDIEIELIDD